MDKQGQSLRGFRPPVYIVIGSGPAGIACAQALLSQNTPVTLLDIGKVCEPTRLSAVRALAQQLPEKWDAATTKQISAIFSQNSTGFPLKLAYGSDFPYAQRTNNELTQSGTQCVESWAQGGLSNVWGAATLPPRAEDLENWPISIRDLEPHLIQASKLMGIAAESDDLELLFPLYGAPQPAMPLSRQAIAMLGRARTHRSSLQAHGIHVGRARLAVRTSGCQKCGLCLSGCPYGVIYNSSHTLEELKKNPRFTLIYGQEVLDLRQNSEAIVRTRDLATGQLQEHRARRVFLAAGVIPSLRILLRSLELTELQLKMQYHPYFLMPSLLLDSTGDATRERLHTLSQFFWELQDPNISDRLIHLQIYTYNPLFLSRLQSLLGLLGPLKTVIARPIASRLAAIQGYLHSSQGLPIQVHAKKKSDGQIAVNLTGEIGAKARAQMSLVQRKLIRHASQLGLLPIPGVLKPGLPGDGNHMGSTFPMQAQPGHLQTDRTGRIHIRREGRIGSAWENVHLVDASVLPDLPPSTLTLTAMANSHRIGTEVSQLDQGKPL